MTLLPKLRPVLTINISAKEGLSIRAGWHFDEHACEPHGHGFSSPHGPTCISGEDASTGKPRSDIRPLNVRREREWAAIVRALPRGRRHLLVREMLFRCLPSDADFDEFCLTHYPRIRRLYSASMDRCQRATLLLERTGPLRILRQLYLARHQKFERQFLQAVVVSVRCGSSSIASP